MKWLDNRAGLNSKVLTACERERMDEAHWFMLSAVSVVINESYNDRSQQPYEV